jgi:hypothetical protein
MTTLASVSGFTAPTVAGAERALRTPGAGRTAQLAAGVALVLLAVIALVATLVRLLAAAPVRAWLGFRFTGVPGTLVEAQRIFAHNARAVLAVVGLLLIAQLAARRPAGPAAAQRWIQAGGELLLAGVIAANLAVVGAALGGYGLRMVRAILPHGPVELAAFAVAIALYAQGRRRALTVRHVIATGAVALGLLEAAALLETLVNV